MSARAVKAAHQRAGSVSPSRHRTPDSSVVYSPRSEELWGLSAMTLRQGNVSFSFGRAGRFHGRGKEAVEIGGELPSTLNPRTTSFGYGQRWTPVNPTGKDSPPPGTYRISTIFETNRKSGYSFGTRLSHRTRKDAPGPGAYEINIPMGKNAPKFSFRPRIKVRNVSNSPPPDTYRPSTSLIQSGRYKDIGFGFGERVAPLNHGEFYVAVKDFPGPGTYYADSFLGERGKGRTGGRRLLASTPASPTATDL